MSKSILGFRLENEYKIFSVDSDLIDHSPEGLGNDFCRRMISTIISNVNSSYKFFWAIHEVEENDMFSYNTRRYQEVLNRLSDGDISWIHVPYQSRGRFGSSSSIFIPNQKEEIFKNSDDYDWAYIYNAEKRAVEFYGKAFKDDAIDIQSRLSIPYYASINVNTIAMIQGLQKNFNVVEFLKRNHEQEIILIDSLSKDKPHKSKEKGKVTV